MAAIATLRGLRAQSAQQAGQASAVLALDAGDWYSGTVYAASPFPIAPARARLPKMGRQNTEVESPGKERHHVAWVGRYQSLGPAAQSAEVR